MLILLSSGSNAHGQLGNRSLDDSHTFRRCSFEGFPPYLPPTGTTRILDIATGANHTIVLLELADLTGQCRREIWGCGDGHKGQLGLRYQQKLLEKEFGTGVFRKIDLDMEGSNLSEYSFTYIAATWETSYAVVSREGSDDVILSFGSNDYGDLGIGVSESSKRKAPLKDFHIVPLRQFLSLVDDIDDSNATIVESISAGQRHLVVHLSITSSDGFRSQIMVGWGTSRHGQLGPRNSPGSKLPPFVTSPQVVALSRDDDLVLTSSLGIHHSIFLHASGRVSVLGSDRKGQLQVVSTVASAKDVKCTWNGTYVVVQQDSGWSVFSSGSNSHSQQGWVAGEETQSGRVKFPNTLDRAASSIRLSCGSEHILSLITTMGEDSLRPATQVWGWGWNEHGNLGVGHTADVSHPVPLWPPPPNQGSRTILVKDVWGGCGTSWISCEDEMVECSQTNV